MNADNAHLYLPLVQALADGKPVQIRRDDGGWIEPPDGQFEFVRPADCYRVKPKPRRIFAVDSNRVSFWSHDEKDAAMWRAQGHEVTSYTEDMK